MRPCGISYIIPCGIVCFISCDILYIISGERKKYRPCGIPGGVIPSFTVMTCPLCLVQWEGMISKILIFFPTLQCRKANWMFNVIFIDVFLPCKIFWAPTVKIYWRSRWSRASKSSWGPRINGLSQCHASNIDKAEITLHYVEVVRLRAVQRSQSWTIISSNIWFLKLRNLRRKKLRTSKKTWSDCLYTQCIDYIHIHIQCILYIYIYRWDHMQVGYFPSLLYWNLQTLFSLSAHSLLALMMGLLCGD